MTHLQKLNTIRLCLSAHPDNEPNSEFADRIAVNETHGENSLSQSQWKENHYSNDIEVFEDLTQQS